MKRARAGSISGRLRSASDLEEKGLIDKSQKGVLKDLIISGDSELQAALDLYDRGDASQLEGGFPDSTCMPTSPCVVALDEHGETTLKFIIVVSFRLMGWVVDAGGVTAVTD